MDELCGIKGHTVKCFSQPFSRFPFNRESCCATETVMCIIKFCLIQLLDKPFPPSPHVIFDFSNNSFCTVLQALCLCLTLLRLLEKYLVLPSNFPPDTHFHTAPSLQISADILRPSRKLSSESRSKDSQWEKITCVCAYKHN